MKNPIPAMKAKLQTPEFQAEAKTLAKAVVGQIVLSTVIIIGTGLAVQGVKAIGNKATNLAEELMPLVKRSDELNAELVEEIANS